MGTPIRLTIEDFADYLHVPLGGITSHGNTLVTSKQPISYGALHHAGYHFDANTDTSLKSDHPTEHEDDDIDTALTIF
ncbi:hypothetical protein J1N35_033993 [Gossypium stocksii]|uniref:Uncharacterized protein n=1 Tax=Gossypium stocksii TaxID=47602 RepID=A0A9D3ZPU0_9ROSI|nr:hypothetical protein J1N35_033993 [Gossypium stocksii]